MFYKTYCEEIITNNKIELIFSDKILESIYSHDKDIIVPIVYMDKFSYNINLYGKHIDFLITRVFDSEDRKVYYFISTLENHKYKGNREKAYDDNFMKFVFDAYRTSNIYYLNSYITDESIIKDNEIIFTINLSDPIEDKYKIDRSYRSELNFIDIVSLLSIYKDELNTIDQEVIPK